LGEPRWLSDRVELDEHARTIRDAPVLDDAAADDAHHIENVDSERATARWMPHVRAVVRARGDVARPDRIPSDTQVFDLELEVGERTPEGRHDGFHAGGTRVVARV